MTKQHIQLSFLWPIEEHHLKWTFCWRPKYKSFFLDQFVLVCCTIYF